MNKLKELFTLNKALGQYNEISKEIDTMDAKSLFASKTFWLNIIGLAMTIGNILPQKWSVPVLVAANIGNRLITDGPAYLLPPSDTKVQ
jgi:hypothetical protein